MRILAIPRFRPYFSPATLKTVCSVMLKGALIRGNDVDKIENAFAVYTDRKHAIAVPSGRMALYVILRVLGLKKGDAVILPAYTVPEVVTMIRCAGLIPRFVDIDPGTYNMVPEHIEKIMGPKIKAILLTHLYGQPCEIDEILNIAERHNLTVIEDAAQACGAIYHNRKAGAFGKISYFSFGLIKNMNTLGGGMVTTDDDALALAVRNEIRGYPYPAAMTLLKKVLLIQALWIVLHPLIFTMMIYPLLRIFNVFGWKIVERIFDESAQEIGMVEIPDYYKRRFSNVQAAIGLRQLAWLDRLNDRRIRNAQILLEELASIDGLDLPVSLPGVKHIYLNLMVQNDKRDQLIRKLLKSRIDTTKGFLADCSSHPAFKEFASDCPAAKRLAQNGFYLPVYPSLSRKDMLFIAGKIRAALDDNGL